MITQAIITVRANCAGRNNIAVCTEWTPTTLTPWIYVRWTVWVEIHYPNSSKSMQVLLHASGTTNWRALKMAENLFPNCKLPHCSYAHTEYDCYMKASREVVEILTCTVFSGDVVTTTQTAQTVCFACPLSTAQEIMSTGTFHLDCL